MSRAPNLAHRAFANTRPVTRVATAGWIVGAMLILVNFGIYWAGALGIEERRSQAAGLAQQIGAEEQQRAAAQNGLQEMALQHQNFHAQYLNQRIAERTFPWSRLFDDLAEVLPPRVHLMSLTPRVDTLQDGRPRDRRVPAQGLSTAASELRRVRLQARGLAEEDAALLDLLDRLFASARFERPSLPRESRQLGGDLQFELAVDYLPDGPARPPIHQAAAAATAPKGALQ